MKQRGRPSNNEGTGASKKNKSNKRQAANQQSTRPRSAPTNNSGNSESPGRAIEKTAVPG